MDVKPKVIAAVDKSREKFVYPVLLSLVHRQTALSNRPVPQTQIGTGL